jgi:hypothetical protein
MSVVCCMQVTARVVQSRLPAAVPPRALSPLPPAGGRLLLLWQGNVEAALRQQRLLMQVCIIEQECMCVLGGGAWVVCQDLCMCCGVCGWVCLDLQGALQQGQLEATLRQQRLLMQVSGGGVCYYFSSVVGFVVSAKCITDCCDVSGCPAAGCGARCCCVGSSHSHSEQLLDACFNCGCCCAVPCCVPCRDVCAKVLPCGHTCPDMCHAGPCAPCQVIVSAQCACGQQQAKRPCYLADWHCERLCGQLLACGRHHCDQVCVCGYGSALAW